jgi:Ca-activated chloride channel homolog
MRVRIRAGERRLAVFFALSLFFALIAAQSDTNQQAPVPPPADEAQSAGAISVSVDLVVLDATVRDKKGGFVSGLEKQDFRVYEGDQPQTIELFRHEDVPVAVGLVLDDSGSMQPKRSDVAAAALAFVRSSNPEDEMFVVNFNENVTFGLPNGELFSAKPSELAQAVAGVPAAGRTALYDAIDVALTHLQRARRDKKALIVISDGGDNASNYTLNQVLQQVSRSDAIIYTIGLFDEDDTDQNPRVLKRIARASGGEAFFPEEPSAAVKICEGIAEDIRNQYTIGYAPANKNFDGSYRTVKVIAYGPGGAKLMVRTRAGYIASPDRNPAADRPEDGVN